MSRFPNSTYSRFNGNYKSKVYLSISQPTMTFRCQMTILFWEDPTLSKYWISCSHRSQQISSLNEMFNLLGFFYNVFFNSTSMQDNGNQRCETKRHTINPNSTSPSESLRKGQTLNSSASNKHRPKPCDSEKVKNGSKQLYHS